MSVGSSATVFRGVRVFDGRNAVLTGPSDVAVRGATIESVRPAGAAPVSADARVIEGVGQVLMPGLIDAHWHATFAAVSPDVAMTADPGYVHLCCRQGGGAHLAAWFHGGARRRRACLRVEKGDR
jgi:imidazolonepropionase-like amidohydrolase